MNFSSDLSTLSTLTESTLLCSIEQRCRGELTEVSVRSLNSCFIMSMNS